MRKFTVLLTLLAMVLVSLSPARPAFSNESKDMLVGSWEMTVCPVDAAGKPCPFIPQGLKFSKDNVILSNMPSRPLQFKSNLTAAERQAIEQRYPDFKGKQILLFKPNPAMDWGSTPMVYVYSVTQDELSLTVRGWDSATFKRMK